MYDFFSIVREYDDVVSEAKREGKEAHMARVHGICVEKNYTSCRREALEESSKVEVSYLGTKRGSRDLLVASSSLKMHGPMTSIPGSSEGR